MTAEVSDVFIGARFTALRLAPVGRARVRRNSSKKANLAIFLILVGLLLPAWEMNILVGGSKFTVGRLGVSLLVVPAIVVMWRRHCRVLACDVFVFATALWMLLAAFAFAGTSGVGLAGATSLELIAGYLAARGFISNDQEIDAFVGLLKVFLIAAVLLAGLDSLTGRWVSHEVGAALRAGLANLNRTLRWELINDWNAHTLQTSNALDYSSNSRERRDVMPP